MINLTNLIALFRHHRKMITEPCSPTCFCHRVEEVIKEETEPKPKPKVIELSARRKQNINRPCKHINSSGCGCENAQPDDYANDEVSADDKAKLPSHVLDALIDNAKKHDDDSNDERSSEPPNTVANKSNVFHLFSGEKETPSC